MRKIVVGDLVRFRGDKSLSVYEVLAVSYIYDMAKLRNCKTCLMISWYPFSRLVPVGFYQPELVRIGG